MPALDRPALVDYRKFQDWAWVFYGGACFLLLLVVSPFGTNNKGAQAWFQVGPIEFQPGELAKVLLGAKLKELQQKLAGS